MLPGIDVSNNQGVIDWARVRGAGYAWAAIKATEGAFFADPYLAENVQGARQQGMGIVLYHFAHFLESDPAVEAAWFRLHVAPLALPGDVLGYDAEADPQGRPLPADCGTPTWTWNTLIQSAFGCWPWVYTNLDMIRNHGLSLPAISQNCGLWYANPGGNAVAPDPWPFLAALQTSWHGSVPGVAGECDEDVFNGTIEQLRMYGLPQIPVAQPNVLTETQRLQAIAALATGAGVDVVRSLLQ